MNRFSWRQPRARHALFTYRRPGTPNNAGSILSALHAAAEWRPPRGTDGTPNESVSDVLVRVRQVMSITETQVSSSTFTSYMLGHQMRPGRLFIIWTGVMCEGQPNHRCLMLGQSLT